MNQAEQDFQALLERRVSIFEMSDLRVRKAFIFALMTMRQNMRRR